MQRLSVYRLQRPRNKVKKNKAKVLIQAIILFIPHTRKKNSTALIRTNTMKLMVIGCAP
jgi:hypothetical protein